MSAPTGYIAVKPKDLHFLKDRVASLTKEVERLRAIETAAQALLDVADGDNGHDSENVQEWCDICKALRQMRAALQPQAIADARREMT